VQTENVSFYSEGCLLSALWHRPDSGGAPDGGINDNSKKCFRAIVQGPGWLGFKDAKLYRRYHEALTTAGFGVLVFDYRGFGDSEGDRTRLSIPGQITDLVNAVTYLTTREDVNADAIGAFGTGGTGGGNAVLLAARDPRVKAVVSQVPVADGRDWLHRMRSEADWLAFLAGLDEDRKQRVRTGTGRMVAPREEIMVPTPERRQTTVKADVDGKAPVKVPLAEAEDILGYRPADAAAGLATPLMVIGVDGDATTPTDHAELLYAAAHGPKALIMQRHTTHYAAYDKYWEQVTPRIVGWFDRYVQPVGVALTTGMATAIATEVIA
jgi:hypothetical protein